MTTRGFTLIEVLVVLGMVVAISTISFSVYRAYPLQNDLTTAQTGVIQALRRAQVLSRANKADDDWGVKMEAGRAVIFKGNDYPARDADYDEIIELAPRVALSGTTEFIYAKFTGQPQSAGMVNLSLEGESKSITVNGKGTISY